MATSLKFLKQVIVFFCSSSKLNTTVISYFEILRDMAVQMNSLSTVVCFHLKLVVRLSGWGVSMYICLCESTGQAKWTAAHTAFTSIFQMILDMKA